MRHLLTLLALLVAAPLALAQPGNPNQECPAGTTLLAKFEWKGNQYRFEGPSGNAHLVTLSGSTASATWTSQQDVAVILIKGGRSVVAHEPGNPRGGTFTNAGVVNPAGRPAGISNVQFCGGNALPPSPPPPGPNPPPPSNPGNPGGPGNPNQECPAGTALLAKFEWEGGQYVFEKPAGNAHLVTLSGSTASATWTSQQDVAVILIKGARSVVAHEPADPRGGTITNQGVLTPSGQLAGISNVQFCAGPPPPDICLGDQGPPEISFRIVEEGGQTFVKVTVTDDVGIEAVTIQEVGTNNLVEAGQDFTPGAPSAWFRLRIVDLTKDAALSVQATDLCGNTSCPDTAPPAVTTVTVALHDGTGTVAPWPLPTNWRTLYPAVNAAGGWSRFGRETSVTDNVGVVFYQTFARVNAFVFEQPVAGCAADAGCALAPALDAFRVVMGNQSTTSAGRYGLLVADACNAFVFDPEVPEGVAQRGGAGGAAEAMGVCPAGVPGVEPGAEAALARGAEPLAFALDAAFPNPVATQAHVRFSLPEAGPVRLVLYDVLGREVRVLAEGAFGEGAHAVNVDASGLPSGTYVYRLTAGERTAIRPLTVVR